MEFFTTSLGPGSTVWVKGQQKIGEGKKKKINWGMFGPVFCFPLTPSPPSGPRLLQNQGVS